MSAERQNIQRTGTSTPAAKQAGNGSGDVHGPGSSLKQVMRKTAGIDAQEALLTPRPVQQKADGQPTDAVHAAAERGIAGGGGALPHGDKIQSAFGRHDVSNVQAHTGSNANAAASAMGASAYATGNNVVLGSGAQDLHTVAHEAAHVVQQRAGVQLAGGVGQSGDAYEKHADAVADAVVQGKSAEGLLDGFAGGRAGQGGRK